MFKSYVSILFFVGVTGLFGVVNAQNVITLDRCRELAIDNHGIGHKNQVLRLEAEAKVSYLKKMVKPQVSAFIVFSYQSDVPDPNSALEFGFDFIPLAKDQYRSGFLVKQQLYDGGEFRYKRELVGLDKEVEINELYKERVLLENSVDDLFFTILLFSKSLQIIDSQIYMIEEQVGNAKALYDNGKVLITDVMQLELALDELKFQRDDIVSKDLQVRGVLSAVTGKEIGVGDSLVVPYAMTQPEQLPDPFDKRLEIENLRNASSSRLSLAMARPRAYFFGVGGYARPGLDLFDNSPNVYGVAGISLVIPVTGWRDHKNEVKVLEYKGKLLEIARSSAESKRGALVANADGEIENLERKISNDLVLLEKHIEMRRAVIGLHNLGEVSSAEVTKALSGERNAFLETERHKLELLRARIKRNRIVTEF